MSGVHWVELCAGAGATTLRLLGGPDCVPLVGWMGGKRRFAGAILDAMGVRRQDVVSATMADAGTWGWVWPVVLDAVTGPAVAEVLHGWRDKDPVVLWQRLSEQPLPSDLVQAAAHWLWMQGRAASNVPVWWDEEGLNGPKPGRRTPERASQRGSWVMGEKNRAGRRQEACQSGTGRGRLNGLRDPRTVAWRVEQLQRLPSIVVLQADVATIAPPEDASRHVVYIDPPYQGCTGYEETLVRNQVLEVAQRWAAAGAVVAVSEAEPLDIDGWHHLDITHHGRAGCKPEWLTMSCKPRQQQGGLPFRFRS